MLNIQERYSCSERPKAGSDLQPQTILQWDAKNGCNTVVITSGFHYTLYKKIPADNMLSGNLIKDSRI